MTEWDALILAGGRGRRLGGADKALLGAEGAPLLAHALTATAQARMRVVVGPHRSGFDGERLRWTREAPPYGGPVAATAAGMRELRAAGGPAALVALLAVDLPAVTAALPLVLSEADPADRRAEAWLGWEPEGGRQPLLAVYRSDALERALAALRLERGSLYGASLRSVVERLTVREVALTASLTADIDTPEQLARSLRIPSTTSGRIS